jgi:hypothetical protein
MPDFVIGSGQKTSKFERAGFASITVDTHFLSLVKFVAEFYVVLALSGGVGILL